MSSHSADEEAVANAVEALRIAMLASDRQRLARICAAELSYGHSGGTLETKNEFVEANSDGRAVWRDLAFIDPSVIVASNVALVRHTLKGHTEHGGKIHAVEIGVLLVWTRSDGAWKLLARQAFRF